MRWSPVVSEGLLSLEIVILASVLCQPAVCLKAKRLASPRPSVDELHEMSQGIDV